MADHDAGAPARRPPGTEEPYSEPEPLPEPLVVSISQDGVPGRPVGRHVAHEAPGILHRAVSIQVVDQHGWCLLQRRAASKALFAHRWTNTCCTHPRPGEASARAVTRRLREEVDLAVTEMARAGVFTYRAVDPRSGLVEYEQDHVYVAVADTDAAAANLEEASELVRLPFREALALVESEAGTPWAPEVLRRAYRVLSSQPAQRRPPHDPS